MCGGGKKGGSRGDFQCASSADRVFECFIIFKSFIAKNSSSWLFATCFSVVVSDVPLPSEAMNHGSTVDYGEYGLIQPHSLGRLCCHRSQQLGRVVPRNQSCFVCLAEIRLSAIVSAICIFAYFGIIWRLSIRRLRHRGDCDKTVVVFYSTTTAAQSLRPLREFRVFPI